MIISQVQNILIVLTIISLFYLVFSETIFFSLLNLIFIFIYIFIFLISIKVEFIAQTLIIIYAGAIIVLFSLAMMLFEFSNNKKFINDLRFKNKNLFETSKLTFFISVSSLFLFFYEFLSSYFPALMVFKNFINPYPYQSKSLVKSFFENSDVVNIGNQLFLYYFIELTCVGLLLINVTFGLYLFFKNNNHDQ